MYKLLSTRAKQRVYGFGGQRLRMLCLWATVGLWVLIQPAGVAQAAPLLQLPQPQVDNVSTQEDTPITIDVLANDDESGGNSLVLIAVSRPRNGTAEIVDNQILYTPNPNFSSRDIFFYAVHNGDIRNSRIGAAQISIEVQNDAPTEILLSSTPLDVSTPAEPLPENAPVDSAIASILANDPDLACNRPTPNPDCTTSLADSGYLFTLGGPDQSQQPENDNRFFRIENGNSGVANLVLAESLVGRGKPSYTIGIQVRDPEGATFIQNLVLQGTDTNDPPTAITLSPNRIDENLPTDTSVGLLSAEDEDDLGSADHTYELVEGSGSDDNASFTIVENELRTAAVLDFEAKPILTIRVRSTDSAGEFVEQILLINLNNLSDSAIPPTATPTATFAPTATPTQVINTPTPGPTPTSTFTPSPTPSPTPQNGLTYCSGDPIMLIDNDSDRTSKRVQVKIEEIAITNLEQTSCTVDGKMTIITNGHTESDLEFRGQVNARNQFGSSDIPDFTIKFGIFILARDVEIEYISERPTLHITRPSLKTPSEFGGATVQIPGPTSIDSGGLNFGDNGRINFLPLKTSSGFALSLTGAVRSVNNGIEIEADGELTIPNIKNSRGSGGRSCGISAGVTIFANVRGQTVMTIAAGKANPAATTEPTVANAELITLTETDLAAPNAIDAVRLSAIRAGASCDPGLPIGNTGLFLTSVGGEITLIPGREQVDVEVEIEAGKSLPLVGPIVTVGADMSFRPRPFKLDLGGEIKVLIFKMARADATITTKGFKARIKTSQFFGPIPYTTDVKIAAFTRSGRKFTFAGSGRLAIEMKRGSFGEKCTPKLLFVPAICVPLPPFNIPTLAAARVEAGEFNNRDFGIKGVASIPVVGSRGFFVSDRGVLTFRNVDRFKLVKPPFVAAARAALAQAKEAGVVNAAAANGVTFLQDLEGRDNGVLIDVPLLKPMVDLTQVQAAGATDVISQVNLIQHGDVLFNLVSTEPISLTLITPDDQEVTSNNYTSTVGYDIAYSHSVVWGEESEPEQTDGDFVEPVSDEDEDSSATLLFTAVSSDPAITGLDLKLDDTTIYYDIDAQDTVWLKPLSLAPGEHRIELSKHGTTDVVLETTVNLITKTHYSLISYGGDATGLALIEDNYEAPESMGKAKVRFLNAATPGLNMMVNGTPLFNNVAYLSQTDYALVDAGTTNIEFRDDTSDIQASESITVALGDGGVYTFFTTDDVDDTVPGFDVRTLQREEIRYRPIYYTSYSVDQAQMNESWKTKLVGDTDNAAFELSVDGLDSAPILGSVSADATNLAATQVSWQLTSDINPTTVQIYANPEEISDSFTITNTDGISDTAEIPLYEGDLLAEFVVTDIAELGGQLVTKELDLSGLESGTYHIWVRADDGINPPATSYADAPAVLAAGIQSVYGVNAVWLSKDDYNMTAEVADAAPIVIDHSVDFPIDWTATITPTFDATSNALDVEWAISEHPDVDSYRLLFGHTPLSPTQFITVGGALAILDENDELTGLKVGFERIEGIRPDVPYFISIEANDSESGLSVRSQDIEFMVESADFALITEQVTATVTAGAMVTVPVTLNASDELFFPNVWLSTDLGGTPLGVTARFADDVEGFPGLDADAPTRMLEVSVDASVADGRYPIVISGYNGDKERALTIQLEVGDVTSTPNVAPIANETVVDVPGATKPIVLGGSDADGDSLTFTIVTQPANGTLSDPGPLLASPNLTYTPKDGFSGTDSFTYTVNDGTVDSAPATVTIRVESTPSGTTESTIFLPLVSQ